MRPKKQKKLQNILNIENTWLDIKCANILHRFVLGLSNIRNNITPVKWQEQNFF